MDFRNSLFAVVDRVQQLTKKDDIGYKAVAFALIRGDRELDFQGHLNGGDAAIAHLVRQSDEWLKRVRLPKPQVMPPIFEDEFITPLRQALFAVVQRARQLTNEDDSGFKAVGFGLIRGDRDLEFHGHLREVNGVADLIKKSEEWLEAAKGNFVDAVGGEAEGSFRAEGQLMGVHNSGFQGFDFGGPQSYFGPSALRFLGKAVDDQVVGVHQTDFAQGPDGGGSAATDWRRKDPKSYGFGMIEEHRIAMKEGRVVFLKWEPGTEMDIGNVKRRLAKKFGNGSAEIWQPPQDKDVGFLTFEFARQATSMLKYGPRDGPKHEGFGSSIEFAPCK